MRAYKYAFNQRVWVPGLERVQGIVVEQRGHAFKGNSYLVTWHELVATGFELKEQVFTEADIDAAEIDRMVVKVTINRDDVLKWIGEEAERIKAESENGWRDWPATPEAKKRVKRAAARKRSSAKRSKRRARR